MISLSIRTSLVVCCAFLTVSTAQAQTDQSELPPGLSSGIDPELFESREPDLGPLQPGRIVLQIGGGIALRIVQNLDFQQERFAPAFLDFYGAYFLPGRGMLRHGVGLGASTNISGDGTITLGVDPFQQWALTPLYTLALGFGEPLPNMHVMVKAGPTFALTPGFSPGIEAGAGFTYQFLAGFGIYTEFTFSGFFGGNSTFHPLLSGELGFQIDYELLP